MIAWRNPLSARLAGRNGFHSVGSSTRPEAISKMTRWARSLRVLGDEAVHPVATNERTNNAATPPQVRARRTDRLNAILVSLSLQRIRTRIRTRGTACA